MCRHLGKYLNSEQSDNLNAQKPKQIVYVWNYLEWGGAQVYFLGLAARLKDRAAVKFVFPRETSRQFINFCDDLKIEYEFLDTFADSRPALTVGRKLARHWIKFRRESEMLRHLKKFDLREAVLHIELSPWQSLLSLLRVCRRAEVFMTMHNALPPVPKWRFLLWKLKFSILARFENFHVFASNEDAKNSLKPLVSAEFLDKIKVTYTNVNPDEVDEALRREPDRAALLQKFGLPADKFLVFCLGQFIDRKGRWTFLEAAKRVAAQTGEIAFVWISNSVLTAEEAAKIESFGLGGRFFLIKSESVGDEHLDLMKFLRVADVFTLPSFVEGLPISLLEAMALGIPSISTNVYAIPEAVKNGETGLLIEAGDAAALAAAIVALKNDEALREKLGRNGRARVLANFNEKSVAEIAWQGYREAFEKK